MRDLSPSLKAFLLIGGVLFVLRLLFGFFTFPLAVAQTLSVLSAIAFVGLPVYAMFRAGAHQWEKKHGLVFLCLGVILHVVGAVLARYVSGAGTAGEVVFMAIVQTGILLWALGIGALLSLVISDKNLMIPIAIFLVGFDMFLIFNPDSPTRRMLENAPAVTQNVLASVPQAKTTGEQKAGVQDLARVGPADLLFAATFFVLLFRFGMRSRQTLIWLIPVLVAYLGVVILFGGVWIGPISLAMLPAMVPIGLTVLLVNRREFRLQGQELFGVLLVTLLSVALGWYGLYRAKQAAGAPRALPTETSQPLSDQPLPEQEGSPQLVP
jgi:hypothetical protein